jgi:hypothetical protein
MFRACQQRADRQLKAAGVVKSLLQYSQSLISVLLHGCTEAEEHQCHLSNLHKQNSLAYETYAKDPFIICQSLRNIFYTPLAQQLKQDVDCLQCFLSTYEFATKEQAQV